MAALTCNYYRSTEHAFRKQVSGSVSGNTSPNAGFLLVRAESGSSTEVSPRFHYAQAQCFQALFENMVQCGILVSQDRAVRMTLTCPGVSQPRPPISMLLTAGFGSFRKTMSLKPKKSSLKLGDGEVVYVSSCFWKSSFDLLS